MLLERCDCTNLADAYVHMNSHRVFSPSLHLLIFLLGPRVTLLTCCVPIKAHCIPASSANTPHYRVFLARGLCLRPCLSSGLHKQSITSAAPWEQTVPPCPCLPPVPANSVAPLNHNKPQTKAGTPRHTHTHVCMHAYSVLSSEKNE